MKDLSQRGFKALVKNVPVTVSRETQKWAVQQLCLEASSKTEALALSFQTRLQSSLKTLSRQRLVKHRHGQTPWLFCVLALRGGFRAFLPFEAASAILCHSRRLQGSSALPAGFKALLPFQPASRLICPSKRLEGFRETMSRLKSAALNQLQL